DVYRTFQIDKGAQDGICKNSAVILRHGLVGKITAVSEHSAAVTAVTEPGNAVGARIVRNQEYCISESSGESSFKLSCFSENTAPVKGDAVETSGAGGVYPAGVLIGTVDTLKENSDGTVYASVIPAVDFSQIHEVMVLCAQEK
ncbi:MAG: rod shape-determining protein MreC, partial [Clostridia bacterium]|nr:rod shape-determining protein MreC [Clostridia bacterium]